MQLLSAADIAKLGLSGLPSTRDGVRLRAEREGWYSEEKTGLGGIRRVYAIPEQYLKGSAPKVGESKHSRRSQTELLPSEDNATPGAVVGTIVGGQIPDADLLALVIKTLDKWLEENGYSDPIPSDDKSTLIAVLYKYVVSEKVGADGLNSLLNKLVG